MYDSTHGLFVSSDWISGALSYFRISKETEKNLLIKLVKTTLEMRDIYITANDNSDAGKESESQDVLPSPETMQLRRSMFGITSPLYKSSRRNTLEDFDDIRSILSHSKIEEKWESCVNEDGGVFYVNVTEDSQHSERSKRQRHPKARARRQRRRQNNTRCPCHCADLHENYTESCENNTVYWNNEESSQKIDSSSMNTNYLESLIDFQSLILAKGEADDNRNIPSETRKEELELSNIKQVNVIPRDQVICPGSDRNSLIETLRFYAVFGAILCHHNQCSQPQIGVVQSAMEETKLIVQHVEPESPAAIAGVVKGDVLLCLNDVEATLYFEGGLCHPFPKQPMKWTLKTPSETIFPSIFLTPCTIPKDPAETIKERKQMKKSILRLISRGVNPKVSSFLKKLTQHLVSEDLKVR